MGPSKKLPALTSLRFVTAFWVFLFHVNARLPLPVGPRVSALIGNGAVGMTFFFILSGFVLTYAHSGDPLVQDYGRYLRKRILRIYPAYVGAVALSLLLIDYELSGREMAFNVVANALSIQAWFPWLFAHGTNGGTWSLSCEWLFYLSFPFLLAGFMRLGRPAIYAILIATWVASCIPAIPQMLGADLLAPYSFPPARFPEFIVGMCAARLALTSGVRTGAPMLIAGALATAALVVCLSVWSPGVISMVRNVIAVPCLAIVIYAAATHAAQRWPFAYRPLVWLGEISYGFYLFQFIPMRFLKVNAAHLVGHELIAIVACFAATTALAATSYHFVEQPLLRRFAVSKESKPAPPAPQLDRR